MPAKLIEQNGNRITVQFTVELTGQMLKYEQALQQSLNEAGHAARPDGEGHVKICRHYYLYFSVAPKDWLSWLCGAQQGRLSGKTGSSDWFSYMNRRRGFGGQMPFHFGVVMFNCSV